MAMGLGRRLVVETSEEAQGCGGDWSPGSPMMKRGQTEHPRAGRRGWPKNHRAVAVASDPEERREQGVQGVVGMGGG